MQADNAELAFLQLFWKSESVTISIAICDDALPKRSAAPIDLRSLLACQADVPRLRVGLLAWSCTASIFQKTAATMLQGICSHYIPPQEPCRGYAFSFHYRHLYWAKKPAERHAKAQSSTIGSWLHVLAIHTGAFETSINTVVLVGFRCKY